MITCKILRRKKAQIKNEEKYIHISKEIEIQRLTKGFVFGKELNTVSIATLL